ncbi:MAG TPA: AI-2E family transporter [Nitrococcus sp.]|nr:AI-2E family transporter [Nitrococcus sp.]
MANSAESRSTVKAQGSSTARPDNAQQAAPVTGALFSTVALLVFATAVLYFGRDILIPFALAILFSFALGPLVIRLRRWGLPRVLAVLPVVGLAFALIGGFGILIGSQFAELVSELPTYQHNIEAKIRSLPSAAPSGGALSRAANMLHELRQELEPQLPSQTQVPVVRLEQPPRSPLQLFDNLAGPLLAPIATAGLTVIFVIFILLEREDLRNRLIRLGGQDLYVTTEAMDEAAHRVSRYLLMQLIVNSTYGIPIGVGLYFIGVPNALLWGVLAVLLRFIPYVGPVIAALFPIVLAIAVDPGWGMLFWTLGLFIVMELISNNFVEPWLYGSSTGLSAVAIIIAAIFWTTLWGPVGLFLSTPLTVCLAVLGRYVPQLRFLDVMLGNAPALSPAEQFYQRLLAGDPDEDVRIAEEFLREHSLAACYDELVLPALQLAEQDRRRRRLPADRRAIVSDTLQQVIFELADHEDAVMDSGTGSQANARTWFGYPVLCIAGRTALDFTAAAMLAQLLERRGISAQVLPADAISPEGIASVNLHEYECVCLGYLGAAAMAQARHACRRLRRLAPHMPILVGLWNRQIDQAKEGEEPAAALGADWLATSLQQAIEQIATQSQRMREGALPPPKPAGDKPQSEDLKVLRLLDTPAESRFDHLTRRLTTAFRVPISLLGLVDAQRQFWKSAIGLPKELAKTHEEPHGNSVCGHVLASNEMLIIEDTHKDRRFAGDAFVREHNVRFYAGVPLRSASGRAVGTLCVIDTVPRTVSESEKALLQIIADQVMREMRQEDQPERQTAATQS